LADGQGRVRTRRWTGMGRYKERARGHANGGAGCKEQVGGLSGGFATFGYLRDRALFEKP